MTASSCSEFFDYDKVDFTSLLQYGNGTRFIGFRNQRGRGIAGVVKRIRVAIPSFLNSPVGRQVTQAAESIASDVVKGSTPAEAFKRAGRRTIRNLTGLGSRKRLVSSTFIPNEKRSYFLPAQ